MIASDLRNLLRVRVLLLLLGLKLHSLALMLIGSYFPFLNCPYFEDTSIILFSHQSAPQSAPVR